MHNYTGSVPVTLAVPVVAQETSSVSSKHYSEIECGILKENGDRVYKIKHSFFGESMIVEVFTAQADPRKRMLFRPADVAVKLGFPSTRLGMYLHRRKNKMSGIFQATCFSKKISGMSGLKVGSYFINLDVCRQVEKDYLHKSSAESDDGDSKDGDEVQEVSDSEGILAEVAVETIQRPIMSLAYAPAIAIQQAGTQGYSVKPMYFSSPPMQLTSGTPTMYANAPYVAMSASHWNTTTIANVASASGLQGYHPAISGNASFPGLSDSWMSTPITANAQFVQTTATPNTTSSGSTSLTYPTSHVTYIPNGNNGTIAFLPCQ